MEKEILISRFFVAIRCLADDGVIRGLNTFTSRYHLNRRNIIKLRNDTKGHDGIFSPVWLMYLARDYMVSPTWLLLGEGNFYRDGWDANKVRTLKKMQNPRKPKLTDLQLFI